MSRLPRLPRDYVYCYSRYDFHFNRVAGAFDARPARGHHAVEDELRPRSPGENMCFPSTGRPRLLRTLLLDNFPSVSLIDPTQNSSASSGSRLCSPLREGGWECKHSHRKEKDPRRNSLAVTARCTVVASSDATPTSQSRAERGMDSQGRRRPHRPPRGTTSCGPHAPQESPVSLPPAGPGPPRGSPCGYVSTAGDPSRLVPLEPSPTSTELGEQLPPRVREALARGLREPPGRIELSKKGFLRKGCNQDSFKPKT